MNYKLSMWSAYYIELDPYQAIAQLAKDGYKYTELSDEHGLTLLEESDDEVATGKKFKEYAKKVGMNIPQGHLWLGIRLFNGDDVVERLKRWINLFEAIGIKNMVLHCDNSRGGKYTHQEMLDKNVEVLSKLKPFLSGKDIVICLENLTSDSVHDVEDLLYLIDKLNDSHFGICLDTGHLNIWGVNRNQKEFILKAGKYLKALHIQDNNNAGIDMHLFPYNGWGTIDWKSVFDGLNEIGYDGIFNYEVPGERRGSLKVKAIKAKYGLALFDDLVKDYGK